jgi:Cu-Zn family superoxide dismutase
MPRSRQLAAALVPAALALSSACGTEETAPAKAAGARRLESTGAPAGRVVEPSAELRNVHGAVVGHVEFEDRDGATQVVVALDGVDIAGFHGVHVHANEDGTNGVGCTADPAAASSTWFSSADGHMADEGELHGGHAGDLPSVLVMADGTAVAEHVTDRFTVEEVVGAAVVLHSEADNFGQIPMGAGQHQYTPNTPSAVSATAATGNAGDRIACGVVQP